MGVYLGTITETDMSTSNRYTNTKTENFISSISMTGRPFFQNLHLAI